MVSTPAHPLEISFASMVSIKWEVVKTALVERGESALQTEASSACGYCIHLVESTFHLHL